MTKVSSRSAQPLSCLYGKGRNGPDNNAMNLTRSAQTDWGPRRLLQCYLYRMRRPIESTSLKSQGVRQS